ncbi:ATP-binding protein [Nonomuraea sp. NPDC049480]|uniref:ATP-binding protein n=1 Tax=Nonomuraea sp. NPDC049480 TaxID=3364353 RepID=UPI003793C157
MGLSVYRIVQEAITNVVRHAAPAHCQASVSVVDRTVRISVVDDGPGQRVLPGQTGGHGLAGMRERAMMYGGAFEAGPRPGSGFGVYASWEIPDRPGSRRVCSRWARYGRSLDSGAHRR